jgi:hypothetical protein
MRIENVCLVILEAWVSSWYGYNHR